MLIAWLNALSARRSGPARRPYGRLTAQVDGRWARGGSPPQLARLLL